MACCVCSLRGDVLKPYLVLKMKTVFVVHEGVSE